MRGPIGGETATSEGWKPETELTIPLVSPVSEVAVKVMGNMHDGSDEGDCGLVAINSRKAWYRPMHQRNAVRDW